MFEAAEHDTEAELLTPFFSIGLKESAKLQLTSLIWLAHKIHIIFTHFNPLSDIRKLIGVFPVIITYLFRIYS